MSYFLQQFLNGLSVGSVYALVALGLTLVYGVLEVPNFSHGALYTIGAYVAFALIERFGLDFWVALGGAMLVAAGVGALTERLVFEPLRRAPPLHDMIAAIGLLLGFEAGVQAIWGAQFRRMASPFPQNFHAAGLTVSAQRMLIVAVAFASMLALHLFLKRTMIGSTIVATAQNRQGAALVGVDPKRVSLLTFAISGALAALAAVLFAPVNLLSPTMGELVITKAFVIIILGGMGSVAGAIIGGLIIGFAESFGAFYISTDYKDIIAFVLLIGILSVRPQGLFAPGRA